MSDYRRRPTKWTVLRQSKHCELNLIKVAANRNLIWPLLPKTLTIESTLEENKPVSVDLQFTLIPNAHCHHWTIKRLQTPRKGQLHSRAEWPVSFDWQLDSNFNMQTPHRIPTHDVCTVRRTREQDDHHEIHAPFTSIAKSNPIHHRVRTSTCWVWKICASIFGSAAYQEVKSEVLPTYLDEE